MIVTDREWMRFPLPVFAPAVCSAKNEEPDLPPSRSGSDMSRIERNLRRNQRKSRSPEGYNSDSEQIGEPGTEVKEVIQTGFTG